jgi:hypothetical protein
MLYTNIDMLKLSVGCHGNSTYDKYETGVHNAYLPRAYFVF